MDACGRATHANDNADELPAAELQPPAIDATTTLPSTADGTRFESPLVPTPPTGGEPASNKKPKARTDARRMVRAELFGRHSIETDCGITLNIWEREGKFSARWKDEGKSYFETLGATERDADNKLSQIRADLDNGVYVPPRQRSKRLICRGRGARITLRQLIDDYLEEKRATRGAQTACDYRSRLSHVLDFAETPEALRRWPNAADIDHEFAVALLPFLHSRTTTRNGCAKGEVRPLGQKTIHNTLETLRMMLDWAASAPVRKLPVDWTNPVTADIVGSPPKKDPLRKQLISMDDQVKLIHFMDAWQLATLGLLAVFPLRREELAGLLVEDVDTDRRHLNFGTRFGGADFTKGKTAFTLLYPEELQPLIHRLIAGRTTGMLLCGRRRIRNRLEDSVLSSATVEDLVMHRLASANPDLVRTPLDKKSLVRRLLCQLGGLSPDEISKEFRTVARIASINPLATVKELRSAGTQNMKDAGLDAADRLYLTGHELKQITDTNYSVVRMEDSMKVYFRQIRPIIDAISQRAYALRLFQPPENDECGQAVPSPSNVALDKKNELHNQMQPTDCPVGRMGDMINDEGGERRVGARVVHMWCTAVGPGARSSGSMTFRPPAQVAV